MTKDYWKFALIGALNAPFILMLAREFSITLWIIGKLGQ